MEVKRSTLLNNTEMLMYWAASKETWISLSLTILHLKWAICTVLGRWMCCFLKTWLGALCSKVSSAPLSLSLQACHCVIHNSILTTDEVGVDGGGFFRDTQSNWDQGFSKEALIILVSLTKYKFYFNQGSCYFIGIWRMCNEGFVIYPRVECI